MPCSPAGLSAGRGSFACRSSTTGILTGRSASGGRLAVFAQLDVGGRPLGVVSIHLENRTDGPGRQAQMQTILEAVRRELPDMPLILGGDLNTNTFDGRDKEDIGAIAASPDLRRALPGRGI